MNYRKNLFEQGKNVVTAREVEIGMIICLSKCRYFYVYDISDMFIDDECSNLYDEWVDEKDIASQHYVRTFYDEKDNEICNIPPDAKVIAFKRIIGNHDKS